MNVDFQIPNTPALARKLAQLRSMMNLDIDERILLKAGTGLLTEADIKTRCTDKMFWLVNEAMIDLIQHADDHRYRFTFGSRSFEDATIGAMLCAYNSGQQIVIVDIDGAERRKNGTKSGWGSMLTVMGVEYDHIMTPDDVINHDSKVLLLNPKSINHDTLLHIRNRVLVWVPEASSATTHAHHIDLSKLFGQHGVVDHVTVESLAKEFQKTVIGWWMSEKDRVGNPTEWWKAQSVQNLIDALFDDIKVKNLFAKGAFQPGQAAQNNLLSMGFILSSPKHMARLLGVYVALLESKEQ